MNHDQITQLLKDYRSYRYAVTQYERHKPYAQAGIANYSAMPNGSGAPELLFAPQGRMADMGKLTLQDQLDYRDYKYIVDAIDGAVMEVLTDDERMVIQRKYLDRNSKTLTLIASEVEKDERTIRRYHKEAFRKLRNSLVLIRIPEVINLEKILEPA